MYQQIDKATHARIGEPGPLPVAIAGWSPPATYDLEAVDESFGLRGTEFWPLVPVAPAYDPATHRLGDVVAGALDPATRTVPATYAVEALPPPPVPESIARWQFAQICADREAITQDEAINWASRGELPPELQGKARLLLSSAATFRRGHDLTPTIGALLGFDAVGLDEIWREGAKLA